MANETPLGKPTVYQSHYDPLLLYPIPRNENREALGISTPLPFHGVDIWNAYELSWLNDKGKPVVAVAQFYIPCESSHIIESKSFKLYLNSLNQTPFPNSEAVLKTLQDDLRKATGLPLGIKLIPPGHFDELALEKLPGTALDHLDIETDCYEPNPEFLQIEKNSEEPIAEALTSNLLKSNCPVTGQPDWASITIRYRGKKINHEGLLKYIISYRNHSDFHEHCIEHIYQDIMAQCHPENLTVYACYTRRGGLDINPFRSNFEKPPASSRTPRQ